MKRGPRIKITPEQLTELARRYPHEDNHALAESMGVTWMYVRNQASKFGWKKTAACMSAMRHSEMRSRQVAGITPCKLAPERLPEFVARYPHVSNTQLAAEFGVSLKFCKNKAQKLGLKKTYACISASCTANRAGQVRATPLRDAVQAHIDDQRTRGSNVAAIAAALEEHHASVATALRHMVDAGRVIRVDGRPHVYFTNPVWAREFIEAKGREQIAAAQATQARKRAAEAAQRSEAAMRQVRAAEKGRGPAWRLQEAVTPAGVKVTRVLTAPVDLRYQCIPGADVPRVFSMVPPGRDPMTGREWGRGL